jgi:peptidoglycan/xylan/chitin deacetylase (PgdA/CDA1 family)
MTADGNGAGGRLLLVTYHYIRDETYPHAGIHPVTPAQLREQIEMLGRNFNLASIDQAEKFVLGERDLSGPFVLLTFDDGLREHFHVARHILEPLGLRGLFFVCSRPFEEGRALAVSKMHWLRSITPPREFRAAVLDRIPAARLELDAAAEQEARVSYPYDQSDDVKLKYLMNFVLKHADIDAALSDMLKERLIDEAEFCRKTYMSEDDLRELQRAGHVVGGHSHSHAPLAQASRAELENEVGRNVGFLEQVLGTRPRWFSYPYGGRAAVPADISVLANKLGVRFAATLFRGWIYRGHDPLKLNRINTNEVSAFTTA